MYKEEKKAREKERERSTLDSSIRAEVTKSSSKSYIFF